jgi:hypothetical protein
MSWTHLDDSVVKKSRKPHRCYLCGKEIPKGASYLRRTGIDDDAGLLSIAMHPECESVTRTWDEMDWEHLSPGDFPLDSEEFTTEMQGN